MPFFLVFLSLTYFSYALYLVVPSHQSIIIISLLCGGYVFLFMVVLPKPEYSVYGFLLVLLFVPIPDNFIIFKIKSLPTVTMQSIMQATASTTLCLNLIRYRPRSNLVTSVKLKVFFYLIIISLVLLIVHNIFYFAQGNLYDISFDPTDIIGYGQLLFDIVFFLGCISFIKDLKKLETLFGIFLVFGIVMSLEVIAYMGLHLPLPFADKVIHSSGRFMDFFLVDYVKVGLLANVAIGSALYFIFSRRNYLLLLVFPLLFLPTIFSYQRAPMATGVLITGIFLIMTLIRNLRQILVILGIVLVGLAGLFFWGEVNVMEKMTNMLKGDVRPDYFSSYMDSWESRLGSYLRGVDVMLVEPLGVGFARGKSFMGSPEIPSNFDISGEWMLASNFYAKIASGQHDTYSHNFFIDFGVEYGLFAFVALLWLVGACLANFYTFVRTVRAGYLKDRNWILLNYANFAILSGIAFYGLYQGARLYAVVFFFAYVTFLVGKRRPYDGLSAERQVMIQN